MNSAQMIDDYVRSELRWHRRLWRKIRKPQNEFTLEDLREAIKTLEELNR